MGKINQNIKTIMFYSNNLDDFKEFYKHVEVLRKNNIEVAFGTYNRELIPLLSSIKVLIVYPTTYKSDMIVYKNNNKHLFETLSVSLDDFLEKYLE